VRLLGRHERLLDPDVELSAVAEREPRSAARAKRCRLPELLESEQVPEEAARLGLAAGRRGDLHVI
jgi:hypothetical protein